MITEHQYRRLMNEHQLNGATGDAAMKAGVHRQTAQKYLGREHPDGVSPLMAMEAVPAVGVRDDVNGRFGASMASGRTPARHNPKMGYRHVRCGYGRRGGFEVWRHLFAFNTREPVIMSLIAEIGSATFPLRSGLRTRSSSRWMRRRCRSAGRCMRSWSCATTTPRPRNTGTEPRAGSVSTKQIHARRLALATPEPNLVQGMPGRQSTFATRLTRFHGQQGPGLQGRYKAR